MKSLFPNPKKIIILTIIVFISLSYNSHSQDNVSDSEYTVLGVAWGTPGIGNLLIGYNINKVYSRISLGEGGYQFNSMYNVVNRAHFEMNVGLGFGYSDVNYNDLYFFGFYHNFNIYGFHFEVGYITPESYSGTHNFAFQIGYVYRFND